MFLATMANFGCRFLQKDGTCGDILLHVEQVGIIITIIIIIITMRKKY